MPLRKKVIWKHFAQMTYQYSPVKDDPIHFRLIMFQFSPIHSNSVNLIHLTIVQIQSSCNVTMWNDEKAESFYLLHKYWRGESVSTRIHNAFISCYSQIMSVFQNSRDQKITGMFVWEEKEIKAYFDRKSLLHLSCLEILMPLSILNVLTCLKE